MLFESNLLGPVEVDESTVVTFAQGLPGFEDCKRFKLFHEEGDAPRVFWMQSLDDASVLFSVVDPAEVGVRYEINLNDDEVAELALEKAEDAAVLIMVYRAPDDAAEGENAHPLFHGSLKFNVLGPLVLNLVQQRAMQKTGFKCDVVLSNG